ncbi:hypothetical protein ACT3TS_17575 [Specibacter sp. AOP5-B1-6]|uniref:hypothetical protein n=1 Tax=Specibacter sp. AOP5-B1-6 TaxID=3457653 RepID=UPI00402BA6AD
MKNKFFALVAPLGLAAVLLAGCSAPQAAPAAHSPAVSATATTPATECGSCDGKPQADHTGPTSPGWDDKSKADALDVATKAMALYNRPKVDGKTWIYDLAQYMTPEAGALYQGVDPANLPAFTTKEPAKLVIDPDNGFGVHVELSTTVGVFDFELLRKAANREWRISHITMPAGLH